LRCAAWRFQSLVRGFDFINGATIAIEAASALKFVGVRGFFAAHDLATNCKPTVLPDEIRPDNRAEFFCRTPSSQLPAG
jgi:hypothetical protein